MHNVHGPMHKRRKDTERDSVNGPFHFQLSKLHWWGLPISKRVNTGGMQMKKCLLGPSLLRVGYRRARRLLNYGHVGHLNKNTKETSEQIETW